MLNCSVERTLLFSIVSLSLRACRTIFRNLIGLLKICNFSTQKSESQDRMAFVHLVSFAVYQQSNPRSADRKKAQC